MYKILVIERDVQFLQTLAEWLTLCEFDSITADTVDQGYRLICLEQPDLILCGFGFPDFEGLRLWQTLQNHPETAMIPFMLMTGAFLEDIPNGKNHLKRGELLFKPFDLNFLIQILNSKLRLVQTG